MEDLFKRKRQELIKEGLEILENKPDKYEMINNPQSLEIKYFLDHLRFVKAFRVSNIKFFDEIFTEVTKYLDSLKPKAIPFREDLLAIKAAVNNPDFDKKCTHFIVIENGLKAILMGSL